MSIAWPDTQALAASTRAVLAKDLAATPYPELREILKQLVAALDRHRQWVADLQSGMFVNCVYCGHRYGPGETTPVAMADALKAHIVACPEHPMSALVKACEAAWHALKSYEHGNAAPALAEEIAGRVYEALVRVKGPF